MNSTASATRPAFAARARLAALIGYDHRAALSSIREATDVDQQAKPGSAACEARAKVAAWIGGFDHRAPSTGR